jgi:hypothetical protein
MYHRIAKKDPSDISIIAVKYGLIMLVGFTSYFLLMYILGLAEHSELRLFNGVIQIFCIHKAIKAYYNLHPEQVDNYMYGVTQGIVASAIGVAGFAIFMTVFLILNPTLMNSIRQSTLLGEYIDPFTANLFIITEGVTVSLIMSYISTRVIGISMKKRLNGKLD